MFYEQVLCFGDQGLNDKCVDKKFVCRVLVCWKLFYLIIVLQKVEFIIDYFSKNIVGLLNGEVKVMVVISGCFQVVKYKLVFDKYIKKYNFEYIKVLVVFLGKVEGKVFGDDDENEMLGIDIEKEYIEYNLNLDVFGDLCNEFECSEYWVMIVVNKFQIGFNQLKLVVMYFDKKVSGVEVVQMLFCFN